MPNGLRYAAISFGCLSMLLVGGVAVLVGMRFTGLDVSRQSTPPTPGAQAVSAPPSQPPSVDLPRIAGGPGVSNSPPFQLAGGDYAVTWATEAPSDRATFIDLRSADSSSALDSHVILNASAGTSGSAGDTNLFRVKPGRYFLAVRAPSNWTVTIVPR